VAVRECLGQPRKPWGQKKTCKDEDVKRNKNVSGNPPGLGVKESKPGLETSGHPQKPDLIALKVLGEIGQDSGIDHWKISTKGWGRGE